MWEPTPTGVVAGITTMFVMPKNELPVIVGPWQDAQLDVMPVWLIWPPANVVMPALAPAAGISIDGIALAWHVSHDTVVGMCAGLKPPEVTGAMPVKVAAVIPAPWHATQLVVMPLWLIAEWPKVAPSITGVVVLEFAPK